MLDSAGPFFNMLFHSLNMPFFPAAIAMLAQDDGAAAIVLDAASDTATVLEDTTGRHTLALLPTHTSH